MHDLDNVSCKSYENNTISYMYLALTINYVKHVS